MTQTNKMAAGVGIAGTLVFGGVTVTDKQINPYTETSLAFETVKTSTVPEAGEIATRVMKDRPAVTFSKWGDSLGVSYNGIVATGKRPLLSKNVEWKQGIETMEAVPLDATSGMEDGGVEINIILQSRPAKNTFDFTFTGTENMDFWYQPALTPEQIARGDTQPENAVGSYAVYSKTKKNHKVGDINYATGKLFHIFRPQISDAVGNTTWGSLSYVNNTLTVTVPQAFLDTATYPVKVDPTFGYSTVPVNTSTIENTLRFSNETMPEAGTLTDMTVYSNVTTSNKNFKAAVYAFTSLTNAGALLGTSDELLATSTGGTIWRKIHFTTQPSLSASTQYFFGTWSASGTGVFTIFWDTVGSGTYELLGQSATYGTFPDPMVESSTDADLRIGEYMTYTASGGGGAGGGTTIINASLDE